MTPGRFAAVIVAALGAVALAVAQDGSPRHPLSVETRFVDRPVPARVGDVLEFEISIDGDGASAARLAAPPELGAFEQAGAPAVADDGGRRTVRYRVQAFRTGRLRVPPVVVVGPDGVASSTDASIDVVPLTTPETAAADAKIVVPPASSTPTVPVVLASLVVAALGYRAARRLGGRPVPGELALAVAGTRWLAGRARGVAAPARALEVAASAERVALEALRKTVRDSRRSYDAPASHAALGRITARFLEAALPLARRERTSAELVRAARVRLAPEQAEEIERVLAACDLVKFARVRPTPEEFRALAARLERIVRARADG